MILYKTIIDIENYPAEVVFERCINSPEHGLTNAEVMVIYDNMGIDIISYDPNFNYEEYLNSKQFEDKVYDSAIDRYERQMNL